MATPVRIPVPSSVTRPVASKSADTETATEAFREPSAVVVNVAANGPLTETDHTTYPAEVSADDAKEGVQAFFEKRNPRWQER